MYRVAFGRVMQNTWRNDLEVESSHVEKPKDTPIVEFFILTHRIYAI